VFCATAERIPETLREIGRLRELAFRGVGEGTGRPIDLDRFDEHYLHLFSWNCETCEVVGAYRLGRSDRILARAGEAGLYTRTLFQYDRRLLDAIAPALELGRSFVRAEYQRNPTALLLLWKGICRFVALHPQYRHVFGAVSISPRLGETTQQQLMQFLEQNHRHADLASLVTALHPPRRPTLAPAATHPAAPEMPVLLRQYLKLHARVLAFGVDPSFANTLDALVVVDLLAVEAALLQRYFGREGAAAFLAHHGVERSFAA
jgi:putative hemolysin